MLTFLPRSNGNSQQRRLLPDALRLIYTVGVEFLKIRWIQVNSFSYSDKILGEDVVMKYWRYEVLNLIKVFEDKHSKYEN